MSTRPWVPSLAVVALALGLGCDDRVDGDDPIDFRVRDVSPMLGAPDMLPAATDDGGAGRDAGPAADRGMLPPDREGEDEGVGPAPDGGVDLDAQIEPDPDLAAPEPDLAPPEPDMAPRDPDLGPDLPPDREPCLQGAGWSLIRVHWDDRSTSPRVDHWDAPCDYSIRLNDNCGIFDRCRGGVGCEVGRTNTGAVELDGTDDLLIWFSTQGLNIEAAVFHLHGRSLCPASPTQFDLDSPRGGWAVSGGPVGQQFEYQWHAVALPRLNNPDEAFRLTAGQGCGRLGVQAFEVCVP